MFRFSTKAFVGLAEGSGSKAPFPSVILAHVRVGSCNRRDPTTTRFLEEYPTRQARPGCQALPLVARTRINQRHASIPWSTSRRLQPTVNILAHRLLIDAHPARYLRNRNTLPVKVQYHPNLSQFDHPERLPGHREKLQANRAAGLGKITSALMRRIHLALTSIHKPIARNRPAAIQRITLSGTRSSNLLPRKTAGTLAIIMPSVVPIVTARTS